jgi:hypothetical protein
MEREWMSTHRDGRRPHEQHRQNDQQGAAALVTTHTLSYYVPLSDAPEDRLVWS